MKYIMSVDQGTTGTTISLVDQLGQIVFQADKDFHQHFPRPGWVEHNPEEIWQTVLRSVGKVLFDSKVSAHQIVGIGITNQRETVVAWDRQTGRSLYPAIVWQCRRTQKICDDLKKKKWEKKIHSKTGLLVDPYFSATKIHWLIENVAAVKSAVSKKSVCFGTIDSFLLFKLTNGKSFATDVSNASRTSLMNLKTLSWDADLLKLFKIAIDCLPTIKSTVDSFGVTESVEGLPNGIPIFAMVGDQQAALFGQGCFSVGESKCTFGTGSFILFNTGPKIVYSGSKLLTTVAWKIRSQKAIYALEGGAYICGAAVQWLRDGLGIINASHEVESLAMTVQSAQGVSFVPAFSGLGAPYWVSEARGQLSGLTRGSTAAHIAFATLEAMALQNVDILLAMEKDLGKKLKTLKVDGGATQNALLMQLQADFLGCEIERPKNVESTSLGAALLAGLGAGIWSEISDLKKIQTADRVFQPKISHKDRQKKHQEWLRAVKRTAVK